ncbi:MAG: hypothetical protein L6R40_001089 [Gallowayella cf. fulva]|nr:MAG: hypothetical protein L6R40_001089 [Xanthomendoza cf. fulva]
MAPNPDACRPVFCQTFNRASPLTGIHSLNQHIIIHLVAVELDFVTIAQDTHRCFSSSSLILLKNAERSTLTLSKAAPMDPPSKRRKFFQRAHDTSEEFLPMSKRPTDLVDSLGKQLPLRAAMVESLRASSTTTRKDSHLAGQGKAKPRRLHPRQLGLYRAAEPVVQPVQTTVASFIDVILDSGGTSVGNVLVPAQSTIFNVDGYGPVTLDNKSPSKPTLASQQDKPLPSPHSHRHSHAAQQTREPEPKETQQAGSTESNDYTGPRVQFTSDLIISSHALTAEPIYIFYRIRFVVIYTNNKRLVF